MSPEAISAAELLLSASPLVVALISAASGWKACQQWAVKPLIEQYEARLEQYHTRIQSLEQREADLLRIAFRRLEGE